MENNQAQAKATVNKPNVFDVFIEGARKGLHIGFNNLMPNMLMAYVLAYMLNLLGIMDFIGHWFGPVMGLLGLPGQALVVLLTTWLSCSAGIGVAASFFQSGVLNTTHIAILMPAMFLMASQIQYMGRLLGVADIPNKYWPMLMAISIVNAILGMIVMNLYMAIFG